MSANASHILITLLVVTLYFVIDKISAPRMKEGADQGKFKEESADKAIRVVRVITGIFSVLILTLAWGFNLSAIFVFATTTITILGAALFANWSLLSNVTAYFVLFFHPAFKRGTFVRIIDIDNYAEGYIADLTMFNTKLVTESREIIVYPNVLLLGRPVLINPRNRLHGVGKLPIPPALQEQADEMNKNV